MLFASKAVAQCHRKATGITQNLMHIINHMCHDLAINCSMKRLHVHNFALKSPLQMEHYQLLVLV